MTTTTTTVDLGKLQPILLGIENAHQDIFAALRMHKFAAENDTFIAHVNVPHLLDILDDRARQAASICLEDFDALLEAINPDQKLGEDWSKGVGEGAAS